MNWKADKLKHIDSYLNYLLLEVSKSDIWGKKMFIDNINKYLNSEKNENMIENINLFFHYLTEDKKFKILDYYRFWREMEINSNKAP